MTESMKKFLERVSQKEELTDRLSSTSKEELLAMAREQGVDLDEVDFVQVNELEDEELDAAVGRRCIIAGSCQANGLRKSIPGISLALSNGKTVQIERFGRFIFLQSSVCRTGAPHPAARIMPGIVNAAIVSGIGQFKSLLSSKSLYVIIKKI